MTTTAVDMADAEADAAEGAAATAAHATCTKRPAPTADRNVKCLSSPLKEDLFTAGTASRSTGNTNSAAKLV